MPRTFLVTGATGAIGGAAAAALAREGAHLVLLCRDRERGTALANRLNAEGGTAEVVQVDLSLPSSIAAAMPGLLERPLDGLVNAAAIFKRDRIETADGLELMFATNHLGPFVLTNLLIPALERATPSRIVTVTAPSTSRVDITDLQHAAGSFRALSAFGASKAENLLFTFALARRLTEGVTTIAFHPGLVRSDLTSEMAWFPRVPVNMISGPPERAGAAIAELVSGTAFPGASGIFCKRGKQLSPPRGSDDVAKQEQLWEASLALAGIGTGSSG